MRTVTRLFGILAAAGSMWLASGPLLRAQAEEAGVMAGVTINADKLDYDRNTELVTATGNVCISRGDMELRADSMTLNRKTSIAQAAGSVRLKRADMTWEGDRLDYNLATKEMQTDRFVAVFPPYQVWAENGAKGTGTTYTLKRAVFSSCTNSLESLHYHIWARDITAVPDSYLKARHAVIYAGPVPVFYLPWMKRSLGPSAIGVNIQPGYQSRMGAYLLTGISYEFTNWFSATTLLDYRSLRGVAGGEELDWKNPGGGGKLHVYLLNDIGTSLSHNDYAADRIPDSSRYRVRLKQYQQFGDGWSGVGELNTMSDEYVLEDFYRRDYRDSPEPLNYLMVGKTVDNQAMSLLVKGRLDDFYDTISRLPEARHEVFLTPLADSGFYYRGYNDAVFLLRQPPAYLNTEDLSEFRVDSSQFVTYPTSAGIFHLVPRAGGRFTWFSKTREEEVVTRDVVVTNMLTDGSVVVSNGTVQTVQTKAGAARLRPLFEVGTEASIKAFKDWGSGSDDTLVRYRHIAEPYANYTLRPNLTDQSPDDFYQFDETDAFGSEHAIRMGMRNTIQFKRDLKLYELFDLDIFETYYFESQQHDEGMGPIGMTAESRPADAIFMKMDAQYNVQNREIDQWNIRGEVQPHDMWKVSAEYRYRLDLSSLVATTLRYMPSAEWAYEAYVRYNLDESRVEEHAYEIQRVMDCMGVKFGFSQEPAYTMLDGQSRDADYNVHVEFWLTVMPGKRWGSAGR
jgi:LPS-assembly protein